MTEDTFNTVFIAMICTLAAVVVFFGGFSWILDGTSVGKVIDSIAKPALLVFFGVAILLTSGGLISFAATLIWTLILS